MSSATVPYASFLDLLLDAVCVVDTAGRFVFVSAACERIFGYSPDEMIGKQMIDMVHPEDRERTLEAARKIMAGHLQLHFENRYLRKDGQAVDIMWSARWSEADQLRIAVARDITAIKRTASMQAAVYAISEAAHATDNLLALIRRVHQIISDLLPAPGLAVALAEPTDGQLNFVYHADESGKAPVTPGPAVRALCAEVVRTRRALLVTPGTLGELPHTLQEIVEPGLSNWLGVPLNSGRETIGVLALQGRPGNAAYADDDKDLLQYISTQVATAIQRKQLHSELFLMAQYDELTGLPNRRLLHDRLDTALARAQRQQRRMCLLFIDLDEFKQVNDVYGHATGDIVLREVARRLTQSVRDSDTVARLGGDEFVVLLEDLADGEQASLVVEKIRNALSPLLNIGAGQHLQILPSIGVALYPEHGHDTLQLLRHADQAMYIAKRRRVQRPAAPQLEAVSTALER